MRKQFEELHPLFDLEKDEQGEYTCVLTRVTWLGFELGKKTLQAEIKQLKAKNTQLTHALVNANAEKSKWQKDYWSQVERSAEYGAMLMTDPDSLEFKCYQKEKQIEELTKQLTLCREENKGLVGKVSEQRQINKSQLNKLINKSVRLTDAEFEYKRIRGLQAKDCLQIMRLTARNEKLNNELKTMRGVNDINLPR